MILRDRQVMGPGYVICGMVGGVLTFALTRLGVSFLGAIHTLVRVDGLQGVWRDFLAIALHKPELTFMDIACVAAGTITALVAYTVPSTARYKLYLMFWIPIAVLTYITPKLVAIASIPESFANESQNVRNELLWINIYFLFFYLISFTFSLLIVAWVFRRHRLTINAIAEILTRKLS